MTFVHAVLSGRRTVLAAVAWTLLVLLGPVASADGVTPLPLTETTVLEGKRPARYRVQVGRGTVMDLRSRRTKSGWMPHALKVDGGRGFVGFLLTGAAQNNRSVQVLAVKLPYAGPAEDGTPRVGVGWGRDAGGQACVRCGIPPGAYDLTLITRRLKHGPPVTVTLRADTNDNAVTRLNRRGTERPVVQQRTKRPHTNNVDEAPTPGWPYSGGFFWEYLYAPPHDVIVVHQATLTVGAGLTPVIAVDAEFCQRPPSSDGACETQQLRGGGGQLGTVRVMRATFDREESFAASSQWETFGNTTWKATNSVLAVGVG